jgi:ubiquinone/menaquinone biosynthesis C-methylase UbiE
LGTVAENFRDADGTAEGGRLVACLDSLNRLEAFRSYKARSWELVWANGASRVLDAACGVGFDVIEMAERQPSVRFVGADMSERFLSLARERAAGLANVDFVQADARRLPMPDACFDAARIDWSLQHIEDPETAVRELRRVVCPGGRVVACEPDWGAFLLRGVDEALERTIAAKFASLFVNPRVGGMLPSLMGAAGLRVERVEATALVFTTYADANVVFDIERTMALCAAEGLVSAGDCRRWSEAAQAASAGGRFVAHLTIFTVTGVA